MIRKFAVMIMTCLLACGAFLSAASSVRAQSASDGAQLLQKLTSIQNDQGKEAADTYFQSLTPEEQSSVQSALQSSTISTDSSGPVSAGAPPAAIQASNGATTSQGAVAASCWSRTVRVYSEQSWTGQLFWEFFQNIYWCGSGAGTGVYGLDCSAWGVEDAWGWNFDGFDTYCDVVLGGYGWNTVKYFSQGSFSACLAWCGVHASPWISQQGADDGQYWYWYDA